ncbi:MAG: hypothetical protein COU65_00885 [Candidatus Pacebacteria bacterium CG10_big_fil_rev_8_21_14_0_10_42_12]|nr:MAG: hypothetical protein COU65_00885 [Candidatus Pacebacteria bacterium CG10_big_fil_rev_8_21_14_0_10_42_12]
MALMLSRFFSKSQTLFADVGSTTTRVVGSDGSVLFYEPTCLVLDRSSQTVISIGSDAYAVLGKLPSQVRILFPIHNGAVADTKVLAQYLKAMLDRIDSPFSAIEYALGRQVRVAISSTASKVQEEQLSIAWKEAGCRATFVKRSESVSFSGTRCLVDIGGQTTECSIVTDGSCVASKKFLWGGILLTELLQRHMRSQEQCVLGWHEAERLKKELGMVSVTQSRPKDRHMAVRGKDVLQHTGKTAIVQQSSLVPVLTQATEELAAEIIGFFAQLPSEVVTGVLDSGVVLVGGGSQLGGLTDFLTEKLSCPVRVAEKPDLASAIGLYKRAQKS